MKRLPLIYRTLVFVLMAVILTNGVDMTISAVKGEDTNKIVSMVLEKVKEVATQNRIAEELSGYRDIIIAEMGLSNSFIRESTKPFHEPIRIAKESFANPFIDLFLDTIAGNF